MDIKLVQIDRKIYVQGQPGSLLLSSEQDVISLLEYCTDTSLVMLQAANFAPAFFDLSTGLLGRIMLKFTNYQVKLAIILPAEQSPSEQFERLVQEANRSNSLLHFFPDQESAEKWLLSDYQLTKE